MKLMLKIFMLVSLISCVENEYQRALSDRLEEIRAFEAYNNTPVVYSDSFRISLYAYKNPSYNPYHPYQFLRDTAETEDLLRLLKDQHPFVKTYAFAALHHRGFDYLLPILMANLPDTTKFISYLDDYGYEVTPADVMLEYMDKDLSPLQKDSISTLILADFHHLRTLNEILLFHKPKPDHYKLVKRIAVNGSRGKFALIALARYERVEDIPLIQTGFERIDYFEGYKVFFMAIEAFNHPDFKNDLIAYQNKINKGWDNQGHDYYFNALAKYQDGECKKVIQEFIEVEEYKNETYKLNNLQMIRNALKKYYSDEYKTLLKTIESNFTDQKELEYDNNPFSRNAWNY